MDQIKKAECVEFGDQHSAVQSTTDIIPLLQHMLRGIGAVVKELQGIRGEISLTREAVEKLARQMSRTADNTEKMEGYNLEQKEILNDIRAHTEGTHSCASVSRMMTIRISDGLQAIFPKYKDSFKV